MGQSHMLGKVIGNYKLMAEVGRGPHGIVYRALDQGRAREVAVKLIHQSSTDPLAVNERLRSLAPTIAQFRHPQLAEFYTTLQSGGELFLVTELIEGTTLAQTLQQAGVLSPDEAGKLMAQVCAPLVWLHRAGLAHGDLKPSNILLDPEGVPKITDLGLAYALADQAIHSTMSGLAYRAPEQLRDSEFDARSDVYALGTLLYELVTGLLPFRRINDAALWQAHLHDDVPSPRNYFPLIPLALENILLRALAKRPQDRFASPAEFQNALFEWLEMPPAPVWQRGVESAPAGVSVITQRAPDDMEIPTLEPKLAAEPDWAKSPKLAEAQSAPTMPEFPWIEPVPDTASFEQETPRRVTKSIVMAQPAAPSVAAPFAVPAPVEPAASLQFFAPDDVPDDFTHEPASETPNRTSSALYDEVVIELDERGTRRRSLWKPLLAVAGLAAVVGIPYAMMRGDDSVQPALPTRSTLNLPSPTVTPQPSPANAVVGVPANAAKAKKAPTPRPTVTPKPMPTAAPVKRATPLPAPTLKPVSRVMPTPVPTPTLTKKAAKAAALTYPEAGPKEKKKGGIGSFFKEILTGKEKEKRKKAEPSATPKKKN